MQRSAVSYRGSLGSHAVCTVMLFLLSCFPAVQRNAVSYVGSLRSHGVFAVHDVFAVLLFCHSRQRSQLQHFKGLAATGARGE